MYKGQLMLYYNLELDEFFIVKRGVIKGYYMLETSFGTNLYKTMEELKTDTTLLNNAILIDLDF